MGEVRKHLKRVQIDHPQAALGSDPMISLTGRARRHGIGEDKRQEVRQLILSGLPHAEVVRRTGVSSGTVSAIRQELKAAMPLYRNTEFGDCVLLACRDSDEDADSLSETFGKVGGPGRIRTDDNTVMSGAF